MARKAAGARTAGQPARADGIELPEQPFQPHIANIDYGDLELLVGYAVRRAQILIYEDFARDLSDLGVTPQRFAALTIIGANPRLKQTELGDILGVARSGAMTVINTLEEMGYVRREPRPGDKRSYGIVLTSAGQMALESITAKVRAHDRRVTAALDDAERAQLIGLLARVGVQDSA